MAKETKTKTKKKDVTAMQQLLSDTLLLCSINLDINRL